MTSSATYTVTATNTGGSTTADVTIVVNDVPSSLSYSPNSFTLTKGTAMTTVTPTVSGGTITSWSVSPSLPAGLSLDSSTGAISGTPRPFTSSATYTVTASNSGGSTTDDVTIVVNDVAPSSLSYSPSSFTLTKGTAMTSVTPTASGGPVVSWSVSPSLPAGLSLDPQRVPFLERPLLSVLGHVHDHGDQHRWQHDGRRHHRGQRCGSVVLGLQPEFLHLDQGNGHDDGDTNGQRRHHHGLVRFTVVAIRSVPRQFNRGHFRTPAVTSSATYTITASNTGGSTTADVTIEVNDVAPSALTYSPNTFTLTKGTAMTTVTPTASGGPVTSWSVSPSLPSGLSLDSSTGAISGTPSAVTSSATYTITASNTGGSTTADVTIEVNDVAPSSLAYRPASFSLTKGTAMTTVTPTSSGGTVTSWSVSPSLPAGLSLDSSTGAISGTPTAVTSSATYTVTASNTGGSTTADVTIVVNDIAPNVGYSQTTLTLTKGTAMSTLSATSTGGTVVSWSVSPSLPAGLAISSTTGAISGTPTAVTSSATYTVTATNTGGSDTATLTIVVNDVAPSSLTYSPNSFTLTKGTAMTTVTPTASGGTITSWSVSPSLPAGLSLDSSTGAISGTPTAITSSASYTVTATNTGGRTTASVTIVVNDVAPSSVAYSQSTYTLTKGTAMTTITPTSSGGTVTSWSVSPRFLQAFPLILRPAPSVEHQRPLRPLQPTRSRPATPAVAIPPP